MRERQRAQCIPICIEGFKGMGVQLNHAPMLGCSASLSLSLSLSIYINKT